MNIIIAPYTHLSNFIAQFFRQIIDYFVPHGWILINTNNYSTVRNMEQLLKLNNINPNNVCNALFIHEFIGEEPFIKLCRSLYPACKFNKILLLNDLDYGSPGRVVNYFDMIFSFQSFLFYRSFKLKKIKYLYFFPHSAGKDFTEISFNDNPTNKILVSGCIVSNIYPVRYKLFKKWENGDNRLSYYKHKD